VATLRGWQSHPPQFRTEFSPKESAVLALLVQGEANKLDVDSRSAAISAALQRGLAAAWRGGG